MPTPPPPAPASASAKKPADKLGQVKFFRVCQWAMSLPPEERKATQVQFAEKATAAMGFPVTVSSVTAVLEATGLKLEAPPQVRRGSYKVSSRTEIVAKALVNLMVQLGQPVPADLKAVADRASLPPPDSD